MWSRLILNNEHTESQTPWSSVAGTLISVSNGTPGSFPAWQQVCRLHCFHLFGSSCRISEDFVPSHGHLVSSWSTGGYERPALILASHLCMERSLILLFGRIRESRRAKSHLAGITTPAESSSWCLRQAVCLLLEYWWHRSRSPPMFSSSDLCSVHAGKG